MGTRRTSTALLAVGACFLVAVATAANVQPLDIEWKVGLTESGFAPLLQPLLGIFASQVKYDVINNESSIPTRSCQFASTWYTGVVCCSASARALCMISVEGSSCVAEGKLACALARVGNRVFMFLFEHRSTHDACN